MTIGLHDALIGELVPGQRGWLPLNEDGTPSGPATLLPPPAPAMACGVFANVMTNPDIQEALLSATGAPLGANLNSNVDWRDYGDTVIPTPPVLDSISPNTSVVGDGLTTFGLTATGSNFKADSVIVYDGVDAVTTFVSETSLTASPFNSATAVVVEVSVRDAGGVSAALPLTWTAVAGTLGRKHDGEYSPAKHKDAEPDRRTKK